MPQALTTHNLLTLATFLEVEVGNVNQIESNEQEVSKVGHHGDLHVCNLHQVLSYIIIIALFRMATNPAHMLHEVLFGPLPRTNVNHINTCSSSKNACNDLLRRNCMQK